MIPHLIVVILLCSLLFLLEKQELWLSELHKSLFISFSLKLLDRLYTGQMFGDMTTFLFLFAIQQQAASFKSMKKALSASTEPSVWWNTTASKGDG